MSTHTGTHMDAPSHFVQGAPAVDEIEPGRLVSEAVMISLQKGAGEEIYPEELKNADIRSGDTVIVHTGWEKKIRSAAGRKNERTVLEYLSKNPGISESAAQYLARKKINALAIDGPSIDAGANLKFPAHRILLGAGILAVENLCNLQAVKKDRFTIAICPLRLAGASGSPVRALAILGSWR